jgi:RHS repeat-associated protein
MAGISDKALKTNYAQNKYRFNGKELQNQEFGDGTGLEEYDFGARMQDPQLGVWHNSDPLADLAPNFSPYTYCYDNPTRYIDPTGMDGEDGNDNGNPQRVKYLYNKSTGEVSTQNVSEEEYQKNTNGGATNLVQGNPSEGGQLRFDYSRSDGGAGAYSVNKYLGTNADDVGLRDDKYQYDGAHYEGGAESEGTNGYDIAGKMVDGGVGGLGAGTGKLTAEFLWSISMNAQIDGSLLSNRTVNWLGKLEGLSEVGEGAAKVAPFIGLGIAALKIREAYEKEGHFGRQTARTGVIAVAGVAGGYGGAEGGAALGAAIGVWFGGVGAVPGAIIGGIIGGFIGSWGGEKIAEGATQ